MSTTFFKIPKGKTVLYLLFLTNSVYLFMIGYSIPTTSAFASGLPILDMKPFGYNFNDVMHLFNTLGEDGRMYYHNVQLAVDLVYPFLFIICYTALGVYILEKLKSSINLFKLLYWLPLVAGVSDYIENFFIYTLLDAYPKIDHLTVNLSATFSVIKSLSTTLYFLLILLALVRLFNQKYFSRKNTIKV